MTGRQMSNLSLQEQTEAEFCYSKLLWGTSISLQVGYTAAKGRNTSTADSIKNRSKDHTTNNVKWDLSFSYSKELLADEITSLLSPKAIFPCSEYDPKLISISGRNSWVKFVSALK